MDQCQQLAYGTSIIPPTFSNRKSSIIGLWHTLQILHRYPSRHLLQRLCSFARFGPHSRHHDEYRHQLLSIRLATHSLNVSDLNRAGLLLERKGSLAIFQRDALATNCVSETTAAQSLVDAARELASGMVPRFLRIHVRALPWLACDVSCSKRLL